MCIRDSLVRLWRVPGVCFRAHLPGRPPAPVPPGARCSSTARGTIGERAPPQCGAGARRHWEV
eukprot:3261402-Alexandrium_andersonii.AAC.1